jgi:hypothetical protein
MDGRMEEGCRNGKEDEVTGRNRRDKDTSRRTQVHNPIPTPCNCPQRPTQNSPLAVTKYLAPGRQLFAPLTLTKPTHLISGTATLSLRRGNKHIILWEEHVQTKEEHYDTYIVKCYIGFCTQGALKWIRKKKSAHFSATTALSQPPTQDKG